MTQRVLVTAGASGIGKEIASAYAAAGAQVCVCDVNENALETAAKDIPGLKTIACDAHKEFAWESCHRTNSVPQMRWD
jgi:short-subunit dehydrogenase involved in D-alanine esterification of teichoic acids